MIIYQQVTSFNTYLPKPLFINNLQKVSTVLILLINWVNTTLAITALNIMPMATTIAIISIESTATTLSNHPILIMIQSRLCFQYITLRLLSQAHSHYSAHPFYSIIAHIGHYMSTFSEVTAKPFMFPNFSVRLQPNRLLALYPSP